MAVTETLRALGSWGITLDPSIPDELWKKIDYYGHVCVHVGRKINPKVAGDSLLKSSRYTGVLRSISENPDQRSIGGLGMAMWLGDPDNKGDVIEDLLTIPAATTIPNTIRALLPASGAVVEGTLFTMSGHTYSGTFQFQSPREAIDYVMQTTGGAWRVNGDGTLDAGLEGDLFVTTPKVVVVRKKGAKTVASFDDMFLRSLGGSLETARDVEDLTTRVLLMAQGSNGQFASATADAAPGVIPYVDLFGNPVKFTRIVQESATDDTNADARAQLQLNRFLGTRDALTLSSGQYDINGDARVGDYIYVHDLGLDLVDNATELMFRGNRINPIKLQLTESTWPITDNMSLFYRGSDGDWIDLSAYMRAETGDTTLVVGGYNRELSSGGGGAFPVTPPDVNLTVPGVPTWVTPFGSSVYQSPVSGETKAQVYLEWTMPLNTDTSPIADGDHWEIRYRTATSPLFPTTHAQMAAFTHTQLHAGTFDQPITYTQTDWEVVYVPWDVLKFRLTELTPNMPYEAQIRAVDNGVPANVGAWSSLTSFQAAKDTIGPATPAAPIVAASLVSVQITHELGKSTGGTFNLDPDLHHLEIHAHTEPLFEPTTETLLGKLMASWGMITGEIPVVGTFPIKETAAIYVKVVAVDETGNKSNPSPSATATAELIDDLHVSTMSVSKLTAGVLTADFINAASIKTAETGARVENSHRGIQGYKADNSMALNWRSDSGLLEVIGDAGIRVTGGGNVEVVDGAVIIKNSDGNVIVELGECADGRHGLQIYKDNGVRVARMGELASPGGEGIETINDLGQLVRVNTLAFGTEAASVSALASTSSTTFGDLPGSAGPFVTATVGNSGRAVVILGCWISNPGVAAGTASLAINTATGGVILADNIKGVSGATQNTTASSRAFLVTGLPAGSTDFLMKYRSSVSGSAVSFLDRHMIVMPY